jgi:hypothetical protein
MTAHRNGSVSVNITMLPFAKQGIYVLLLLYIFCQADHNVPEGLFCVRADQQKSYVGK